MSLGLRRMLLVAAAVLANLPSASVVQAQDCFRGQPLPTCKWFGITELGYAYRIDQPLLPDREYFTLALGVMANLDERSAVGGTAFLRLGTSGWGFKSRYRRWLSHGFSLEASPGILLHEFRGERATGFTGDVAVNFKDWVAATASFDAVSGRDSWSVGIRLGSEPAIEAVKILVWVVIALGCAGSQQCN